MEGSGTPKRPFRMPEPSILQCFCMPQCLASEYCTISARIYFRLSFTPCSAAVHAQHIRRPRRVRSVLNQTAKEVKAHRNEPESYAIRGSDAEGRSDGRWGSLRNGRADGRMDGRTVGLALLASDGRTDGQTKEGRKEGTKKRRNEGTKERRNEGTKERRKEGTKSIKFY